MATEKQKPKLSNYQRFEKNPFIHTNGSSQTREKRTLTKNYMLVDPNNVKTSVGKATIINEDIYSDKKPFVKFYHEGLEALSKINSAALQLISQFSITLKYNQTELYIYEQHTMELCGWRTKKAYYDGLADLVDKNFLARSNLPNKYFLNPDMMFKGNRDKIAISEDEKFPSIINQRAN